MDSSTSPAQAKPSTTPETTTQTSGVAIYKRLVAYALAHKVWLGLAITGLVISALTQPLFASLMEPLLDQTFMEKDPDTIKMMPIMILVIFLVRGSANFLSGYFMSKVGRTVVMQLRQALFEQLLHLPITYYDHNPSGKILAKLTYHVEQLATASTQGLTILVQDVVIILGLLGLMFYHSWQLTLGLLIIAPMIGFLVRYVTKRFRDLSNRVQTSVGQISQIASETIQAQREVRIFNGLDYERQRFNQANQHNLTLHLKHALTQQISTPIIQFMVAVALSLIIFIATQETVLETLTPGRFMSFIMAMILLLTPIKRLSQINATLQNGIAAGESIFAMLDEAKESNQGTVTLTRANGNIRFDKVHFHYHSPNHEQTQQQSVIDGVSLTVNSGQTIALVGKSGSGKTSLVNLLPRFYDYQSGVITLDNHPITAIELDSLRQQFAYVGQDVTLFNDSIRNNITYGTAVTQHDQKALESAAKAAHALDFIQAMPQGFDTEVGDNGVLLSGGQRQRLAIARAILADAPILILDEATSALDTEAERHIQAALEALIHQRTTFIIAHRLSTIEKADRILVMDQGCIIESGSHNELLANDGAYAKLYAMQFHE